MCQEPGEIELYSMCVKKVSQVPLNQSLKSSRGVARPLFFLVPLSRLAGNLEQSPEKETTEHQLRIVAPPPTPETVEGQHHTWL